MDDTITSGTRVSGLIERVKGILLKPNEEWAKIETEPSTVKDIMVGYVLPLAAIGPIAGLIGSQVFGYSALGITFKPSLVGSISMAIVSYVLSVVGIFVLALIAEFLATKFDGQASRLNAVKLIAYGSTASMLAGVFGIIPQLAILGILGLYSLYLIYTGVEPMMKVPKDKAAAFTAVTIVSAIVVYIVVGALASAVTRPFTAAPSYVAVSDGTLSGKATIPGVGAIDVGKMQQASEQMQAAANGKQPAVEPAKLQALLPAAIGGYQRTALESTALGPMGSEANGTYTAGDKSFHLKVTDMAAMGGLAALGSAIGVSQSREDADGYERTATVNGQMQTESWSKSAGSGKFGTVIGNRFMVEAEGAAANVDELKAAVASVDAGALAGLVG